MTWQTNILPLILGLSRLISARTQHEAPPVDCEALDDWLPVGLVTSSGSQQDVPYSIRPEPATYRIGRTVSVTVDGATEFVDVIIQARAASRDRARPIGMWASDNVTESFSCHEERSKDTAVIREPSLAKRTTFEWLPLDEYGRVQFIALVTKPNGRIIRISSDGAIDGAIDGHSANKSRRTRLKRDVQAEISTNGSTERDVTNADAVTMDVTPTTAPIDLEAFFYYFSIAGAYVGMYTVFSLLLV